MLPVIPIALGASALLGTLWGAKKGVDAKNNFDQAGAIRGAAEDALATERRHFDFSAEQACSSLEQLGALRLDLQAGLMKQWTDAISLVRGVEVRELLHGKAPVFAATQVSEIRESSDVARQLLGGVVSSVSAGVGAYTGAIAAAGAIGTASTGTAISALSGAAATKASIAWLGGGAVSAGGLGVAGGTAVLGGLGIGAVALMAGVKAEAASQEALVDAERFKATRTLAAAEYQQKRAVADAIAARAHEIRGVLERLADRTADALETAVPRLVERAQRSRDISAAYRTERQRFDQRAPLARWVLRLIGREPKRAADPAVYHNFDSGDREAYEMLVMLGIALYNVLKLEVIDGEGAPSTQDNGTLAAARTLAP